jgi:hypothetical protein
MPKEARVKHSYISAGVANFKPPVGGKAAQSWKYQGGVVARMSDVMINGAKYCDHPREGEVADEELPRRKQETNFFLTINTNQCPMTPEDFNQVMTALNAMNKHIAREEVMAGYMKFGPCHANYVGDKWADVILEVTSKWTCEIGPKLGRAHSHGLVSFSHCSQIQIAPKLLQQVAKDAFNQALPLTSPHRLSRLPYVHAKLLQQTGFHEIVKNYIHKDANYQPAS